MDTWWSVTPALLILAGLVLVPGLAMSYAIGLRGLVGWGLAPTLGLTVLAVSPIAARLLSVPWSVGAWATGAVTFVALALFVGLCLRLGWQAARRARPPRPDSTPPPRWVWPCSGCCSARPRPSRRCSPASATRVSSSTAPTSSPTSTGCGPSSTAAPSRRSGRRAPIPAASTTSPARRCWRCPGSGSPRPPTSPPSSPRASSGPSGRWRSPARPSVGGRSSCSAQVWSAPASACSPTCSSAGGAVAQPAGHRPAARRAGSRPHRHAHDRRSRHGGRHGPAQHPRGRDAARAPGADAGPPQCARLARHARRRRRPHHLRRPGHHDDRSSPPTGRRPGAAAAGRRFRRAARRPPPVAAGRRHRQLRLGRGSPSRRRCTRSGSWACSCTPNPSWHCSVSSVS